MEKIVDEKQRVDEYLLLFRTQSLGVVGSRRTTIKLIGQDLLGIPHLLLLRPLRVKNGRYEEEKKSRRRRKKKHHEQEERQCDPYRRSLLM